MLFQKLLYRMYESLGKAGEELANKPRVVVVLVEAAVFFLLFFTAFLPIPAVLFTILENDLSLEGRSFLEGPWGFLDSLYYTFVTLSTIGFGDMVPGGFMCKPEALNIARHFLGRMSKTTITSPAGRRIYLAGIIVWVILGMGYIFGVVGVISDTLRAGSKPVKKAIHVLKNQLHLEDYWRKILGEVLLLKHGRKPQPGEPLLLGGSGGSQPNLGLEPEGPVRREGLRRRAVSEGELDRLDREEGGDSFLQHGGQVKPYPLAVSSLLPGSGPLTKSVSSGALDFTHTDTSSLVSLDHDTITSLKHFLTTARPGWTENNPGGRGWPQFEAPGSAGGLQVGSRGLQEAGEQSSGRSRLFQKRLAAVEGQGDCGQARAAPRLVRRPSTASRTGSCYSRQSAGGPASQLLEDTTLGEFLAAVESVRQQEQEAEVLGHLARTASLQEGRRSSSLWAPGQGAAGLRRRLSLTLSTGSMGIQGLWRGGEGRREGQSATPDREGRQGSCHTVMVDM